MKERGADFTASLMVFFLAVLHAYKLLYTVYSLHMQVEVGENWWFYKENGPTELFKEQTQGRLQTLLRL